MMKLYISVENYHSNDTRTQLERGFNRSLHHSENLENYEMLIERRRQIYYIATKFLTMEANGTISYNMKG